MASNAALARMGAAADRLRLPEHHRLAASACATRQSAQLMVYSCCYFLNLCHKANLSKTSI